MVKTQIIEKVAETTGVTKAEVKRVLDAAEEVVMAGLAEEGKVSIGTLGNLKASYRRERIARNPQKPDETIKIPEKVAVGFKASKAFAEKVNNAKLLKELKKEN